MQLPVPTSHNSLLDYVLIALFSIISTLGTVAWYFIRKQMNTYDAHIVKSIESDERLARLEEQTCAHEEASDRRFASMDTGVTNLDRRNDATTRTLQWLGDCIVQIAARQGIELPQRPNGNGR